MTTESASDTLAELQDAAAAAAAAAREARAELDRRQRAVPAARDALSAAHAASVGIKAAETAFERAQAVAADATLLAKIDGLTEAARRADLAARQHIAANVQELIDSLEPRASANVARVQQLVDELRAEAREWSAIDQEISRLTRDLRWFTPARYMPNDPFQQLRKALNGLDEIPPALPRRRLEDPGAEQARLLAEHEARVEAAYARRRAAA